MLWRTLIILPPIRLSDRSCISGECAGGGLCIRGCYWLDCRVLVSEEGRSMVIVWS